VDGVANPDLVLDANTGTTCNQAKLVTLGPGITPELCGQIQLAEMLCCPVANDSCPFCVDGVARPDFILDADTGTTCDQAKLASIAPGITPELCGQIQLAEFRCCPSFLPPVIGDPGIGGLDENGCNSSSDWCPETQTCIQSWMETCPIEDGQTFVGGTELRCLDGRCNTDERCTYDIGLAWFGFFYMNGVNGHYEVPSGCTLTCTGCEPAAEAAVADDAANRPAAINCINAGGAVETLTQADGVQYGVCRFSDGSACDAWALFRGECAKGDKPFFSSYCADSGGEMSKGDVFSRPYGNVLATYEVCTVNGAQCAAEDYYSTGCVSGTIYCTN